MDLAGFVLARGLIRGLYRCPDPSLRLIGGTTYQSKGPGPERVVRWRGSACGMVGHPLPSLDRHTWSTERMCKYMTFRAWRANVPRAYTWSAVSEDGIDGVKWDVSVSNQDVEFRARYAVIDCLGFFCESS